MTPTTSTRPSSKRITALGIGKDAVDASVHVPDCTIENIHGLAPQVVVEPEGVDIVIA